MQPTYSEIFGALGKVENAVTGLLESLVAQGTLPSLPNRAAEELHSHTRAIAARLAAARPLEGDRERYAAEEFVAALRAEIDAKPKKTPYCPPVLAAFEAHLATRGIAASAA